MELNREEIVKALECCASADTVDACRNGCPIFEKGDDCECVFDPTALHKHALSLIKELSEENKSARLEYAGFAAGAKSAFDSITKALIEDNKRLSDTVETLRGVVASKDKIIKKLTEEIEVIKAELETRPPKLVITKLQKDEE